MFKLLSPSAPWYRHVEGSPGILCTIPKKLCFLRFTLFTNILVHFPNLHTKIAKRMRCRKVMICINRPPTLQPSPIPKEYGPKRWRSWIERTEICWYLTVAELTDTLKTSILWEETRDRARTLRRDYVSLPSWNMLTSPRMSCRVSLNRGLPSWIHNSYNPVSCRFSAFDSSCHRDITFEIHLRPSF